MKMLAFVSGLVTVGVVLGAGVATSEHHWAERTILHSRHVIPPGWNMIGRGHPKQTVDAKLALRQENLELLNDIFFDVSDPDSLLYGQYLSVDEITSLISPQQEEIERVIEWLIDSGVEQKAIQSYGDSLHFRTTLTIAETLFQTQIYNFAHDNGRSISRQFGGPYSIPEELDDIIEMVTGIADFPVGKPDVRRPGAAADGNTVPATINSVYNIGKDDKACDTCSQSAVEFQGDSGFNKNDLKQFELAVGVPAASFKHIVGPLDGEFPDTEATLDVQYITAVGQGAENWYWTEKGWMYDFANTFFNTKEVPSVLSLSWGWRENQQCSIDTTACSTIGTEPDVYIKRVNTEFMKIGLRGVSMLVSSGDSGANGRTDSQCEDSKLHPDFPASSPYVTAVGATQLQNPTPLRGDLPPVCAKMGCSGGGDEVAVSYETSGFTSGGGFSEFAKMPKYQKKAVGEYLKKTANLPPKTMFAFEGRGYPDIAALGHNYLCLLGGEIEPVGGTSASAPTLAGIVSILNGRFQKNGSGKSLGFLNPLLYKMAEQHPATFNDVKKGDNACTESGCDYSCKGFAAAEGWDAVTGLGTPNVGEMLKFLDNLKEERVQSS